MKNVTISMDEKLYRLARIEAAKAGVSMSKFMAQAIDRAMSKPLLDEDTRKRRIAAISRFLAGPDLRIAVDGHMPNASERNER